MKTQHLAAAPQRGFALMTSILLLFIITILALSMFRGFATQEHIAGNLREKERALHAATSAEQYAEWWLLQGTNGNTADDRPVAQEPCGKLLDGDFQLGVVHVDDPAAQEIVSKAG